VKQWQKIIIAICLFPLGSATAISPGSPTDPPSAPAKEQVKDTASQKRGRPLIVLYYHYSMEMFGGVHERLFKESLANMAEAVTQQFPIAATVTGDSEKVEDARRKLIKQSVDQSWEIPGPCIAALIDDKVLDQIEGELTPKDKPAAYKNFDVRVGICDFDGSRMRFVDIDGNVRAGDETWKMSRRDFARFRRLLDREIPEDIGKPKK